MADLAPVSVSPSLLQPTGPANAAELAKRGQIQETARKFETQFLSIMLQQMFEGVEPAAPFDGGPGESMFKSFMTEAMANQMVKSGGIGLSDTIAREMLKLQGLK
ncbi:rod-binding protein [Phenylobacterium sp.]|jgi:Rod binding domain-containing protein|uniref:rod-binding protein n=1 Tax=Phenylobacterium sp. TaxID=1871053 RepID=UPI002F932BFB